MSVVYTVGTFSDQSFNCYNNNNSLFDPLGIGTSLKNTNHGSIQGTFTNNCFIIGYDGSNNVKWANKMGGPINSADTAYCVCTDLEKSVYVTGLTNDISFNVYQSDNTYITLTNPQLNSLSNYGFIVKYNNRGYILWATYLTTGNVSGPQGVTPTSICTDLNNNLYIGGYFDSGQLKIYDTSLNNVDTLNTTNTDTCCFLVSYKSLGAYSWATLICGPTNSGNSSVYNITTDLNNNLYAVGSFSDPVFNIYSSQNRIIPTLNLYNTVPQITSNNYSNGFLVKFTPSGSAIWATKTASTYYSGGSIRLPLGGTNSTIYGSIITGVCCDFNNNVYVTGTFGDASYNFYDNTGANVVITINNTAALYTNATTYYTNGFIAMYGKNGTVSSVGQIGGQPSEGGSPYDKAIDIAIDLSNNIYVTGQFNDSVCNFYGFTPYGDITNTTNKASVSKVPNIYVSDWESINSSVLREKH